MNPATADATKPAKEPGMLQQVPASPPAPFEPAPPDHVPLPSPPWWQRIPAPPMALTAIFLAFVWLPPIRHNQRLVWTFSGIAGALFIWELILWLAATRRGRVFRVEFFPVR